MCLISVRLSVTTSNHGCGTQQQRNARDGIRRSSCLGMESIEGPQWACILIPRLQHTFNLLKPSPYTLHTSIRHYLLHLTILRSTRSTQPTITLRPQHSTNLAETFAVPNQPRPRISPSPWGASQDDPMSITHLLNASDCTTNATPSTTYPRDPRMSVAYILNPINSSPNPNISTPEPGHLHRLIQQ